MDQQNYRVLVVDDHPAICDRLKAAMNDHPAFEYAGRASNETELLNRLSSKIDLLVLDIVVDNHELPGLLKDVREKYPTLKTVIFTGKEDLSIINESLNAGAHGFLSKKLEMKEVCDALSRIVDGRIVIELGSFTKPTDHEEYQALSSLTKSEKQVLILLCKGFDKEEAAKFLSRIKGKDIKESTIAKHQTNVRKTLQEYGMETDFCIGYKVGELKPFDNSELEEDFDE